MIVPTQKGGQDAYSIPEEKSLEQLARIYKSAQRLGLNADLQNAIVSAITQEFDKIDQVDVGALTPREWEIKNCDLKIRQAIASGGEWLSIKAFAWKRFRLEGTSEAAAKLVESVFMSGTIHEAVDTLAILNHEGFAYYFHLEPRFREHVVFKLMRMQKTETLRIFLSSVDPSQKLIPVEHLYIYLMLKRKAEDESASFIYYRRFETELVEALTKFGTSLGLTLAKFYLDNAELAIRAGFIEPARILLKNISPEEPEYSEALELMMVLQHDKNSPASESLFKKLEQTQNWTERVALIEKFIEGCHTRSGQDDIRRPAVNEILADPFKWVPELPTAWAAMVKLIAQYAHMVTTLPSMLNVFRESALVFRSPALEIAVWKTLRDEIVGDAPTAYYWRAVADLHLFVNNSLSHEERLWEAKRVIESADSKWAFALPYRWKELHEAAYRYLARAPYIKEIERQDLMLKLRICADGSDVNLHDLELYLKKCERPVYEVLLKVEGLIVRGGAKTLEKKAIQKRTELTHYRNEDLNRIWKVACQLNDFDLAWRSGTILESRLALHEAIVQPWKVSGEKRSDYPFYILQEEHIQFCFKGFSKEEKKLAAACLRVGAEIPQLLAALDENAKITKVTHPPLDSFEATVEKALNGIVFLPHMKKNIRFSHEGLLTTGIQLPDFIQLMPSNVWSYLFLRLAERMGISSWLWKFSKLQEAIECMIPQVNFGAGSNPGNLKVAKWLRSLKHEQRSAWHDLSALKNKMDDEQVTFAIAKFLARLSILIHPAHVQALKSLRMMRAPVALIWDLEMFILSDEYSYVRNSFQSFSRVQVPINLRQVATIVKTSVLPHGS